jgi:hypothetical protein
MNKEFILKNINNQFNQKSFLKDRDNNFMLDRDGERIKEQIFTPTNSGDNFNFKQLRNYIDYTKSNAFDGFANSKEHREHYQSFQDKSQDRHNDYFYHCTQAMKDTHEKEIVAMKNEMDERNRHGLNDYFRNEDLFEKVNAKHELEKNYFNYKDNEANGIENSKEDYTKLENSYIKFNQFERPDFKQELESDFKNEVFVAETKEKYSKFVEKSENREHFDKVNEVSNYIQNRDRDIIDGYIKQLNNPYEIERNKATESLTKFNSDTEFKAEAYNQYELKNGNQLEKLTSTIDYNHEPIKYDIPTTAPIEQPVNDSQFDTQTVKNNIQDIRANAMTKEEEKLEDNWLLNNYESPEEILKNQNAEAAWEKSYYEREETQHYKEVAKYESLEKNDLEANIKPETINKIEIGKEGLMTEEALYNKPELEVNQKEFNIESIRNNMANIRANANKVEDKVENNVAISREGVFNPAITNTNGLSYNDNEMSFRYDTKPVSKIEEIETLKSEPVFEIKDRKITNWNEQPNEVKQNVFNDEQSFKEAGIEYESVIPPKEEAEMRDTYYKANPDKKELVENLEKSKLESTQKVETQEPKQEDTNKQELSQKINKMRMQAS